MESLIGFSLISLIILDVVGKFQFINNVTNGVQFVKIKLNVMVQ